MAEELIFGDPSTGASNDISQATEIARQMVTEFGMSAKVGAVHLSGGSGEVFLGRDVGHGRDYSEELAAVIDSEVRVLMDGAAREAADALRANKKVLDSSRPSSWRRRRSCRRTSSTIFKAVKKMPERKIWDSGHPKATRPKRA